MTERLNHVMSKIEVDEKAMQRNLKLTGGAIAAEPLYLLLEKYGHTAAHEASKKIALHALRTGTSLYEAMKADKSIVSYRKQFNRDELRLIEKPEKYYTGLAKAKAIAVYEYWHKRLPSN